MGRGGCGSFCDRQWGCIQGQHLVNRFLIRNQSDADKRDTGLAQVLIVHVQALQNGGVGIIAEPLGIGYGEQKQVKGSSLVAALVDVMITDQPVIHPTELFGDFADALGADETLLHVDLLWHDWIDRGYRCPIVACG